MTFVITINVSGVSVQRDTVKITREKQCCAIAMMFICPSVCLGRALLHCDHTVHFSADLSLRLDSPMF